MSRLIKIFIVSIIISCQSDKKSYVKESKDSAPLGVSSFADSGNNFSEYYDTIESEEYPVLIEPQMSGIGVVTTKSSSVSTLITLLNLDNSVYGIIDFSKDFMQINGKSLIVDEVDNNILDSTFKFKPRQFHPEYNILHFDCITKQDGVYEIRINDNIGDTKKMKFDSSVLEFFSWEEYISKAYILFDPNTNPLRESPMVGSRTVYDYNDFFFSVLEIKGDWIKIKCNSDCKKCEKGDLIGWIRWKDGNKFLIQLGFIC